MDKKGAGIIVVVLFLGAFGVVGGVVPTLQHNIAVQEYEPTTATVQSTSIDVQRSDDETNYVPVVTYEYTVEGETYTENNVYPGQFTRSKDTRGGAEQVTGQYRPGETVSIHYDPTDHGDAYLRNDGLPDTWWLGVGYGVVAAASGSWFIWLGFKRRKQRALMRDTPTENVQSLSIGPSEIKGTAVTEDLRPASAPFSEDRAVVAKYEIEEYDEDNDDDGGNWDTIKQDTLHKPFYVDDGTGSVLVRPHDEATFDLDPEDWSTIYVDSGERGPEPVREFVGGTAGISFPSDAPGRENDRKYRQNLITVEESVYVFGTVHPRDESEVETAAANEERLVVRKTDEDSALSEPMYMISDDSEKGLTERRKWALWRLPVGVFFLAVALSSLLLTFGPRIGVPVPVVF